MAITSVRLATGNREMIIKPREGIAFAGMDAGFPDVREVSEPRTDDTGERDTSALFGAAAISLTLTLYDVPAVASTRALLDELRSYCHPGLRPYLIVSDDDWPHSRRIRLRADQQSTPLTTGRGRLRDVQAQWKAPDGSWEATEEATQTVTADTASPPPTETIATAHTTATSPDHLATTETQAAALRVNADAWLYNPAGALKEPTRFQITGTSPPSGGQVSVFFSPNAAAPTTAGDQLRQSPGLTLPVIYPLDFEPRQGSGARIITNPGTVDARLVARLYGPCRAPRLTNDSTGQTLTFTPALSIPAGDYVEINTRDRTALYLSQTGASRLGLLDFAVSRWWRLQPGDNKVRYHPAADVGPGCAAVIDYRPAWL